MSNLVHVANALVCPGIKFNPDRDTHDAMESIDYLCTLLSDFGYQHCIYGCIRCLERMDKDDKKHLPLEPPGNYGSAFAALHNALGQLPENLYFHLSDISNGGCPACAVLTALQQFSTIARYSGNAPVGWNALPCYLKDDMDERCNFFSSSVRHIDALRSLDLSKLPSRMPPAERRDAKANLAPGKAVVEFVRNFLDGHIQLSPVMTDNDLWTLLKWRPSRDSLEFSGTPSRQWKAWAKKEFTSAKESGSPLFLCRVLRVALDCYVHASHAYIEGYDTFNGLRRDKTSSLYQECEYLCGVVNTYHQQYGYMPFNTACEEATGSLLSYTRGYDPAEVLYYKLTFIGDKECQKFGGLPPPFYQHEIETEPASKSHYTPAPVTVTTTTDVINNDATANSNAQAAATGGKSDSTATIVLEKDAVKAESRIESGAVKMEANPTINVAAPDMKPFADLFAPLVAKLAEPEKRPAPPKPIPPLTPGNDAERNGQMADAALWVEWQRKRGEGVSKTEFSLEKGITVIELQAALDRHRDAKYGIVKPMSSTLVPEPAEDKTSPIIGGWTTRIKVAGVLNRDPKTLKNWEDAGQTPDGISWPKGERQGNVVFYRTEDAWPAILRLMPDIDRNRQKQLLSEIMEMRNSGGDEVPF